MSSSSSNSNPFLSSDSSEDGEYHRMVQEAIDACNVLQERVQHRKYNAQPKSSQRRRRRAYIERGREKGYEQLYKDYFSDQPTYPDDVFRCRFGMSKEVFERIVERLRNGMEYFQQRPDASELFLGIAVSELLLGLVWYICDTNSSQMANKGEDGGGLEALHRLKETEPPLFLTPSSDLSFSSRTASEFLFSSLKPYTPKSPFDQLLTNGFDAEQIWQQIDLQSQPLISSLRREIKRFEKDPGTISKGFDVFMGKVGSGPKSVGVVEMEQEDDDNESDEFEDEDDDEEEEEEEKEEDLKESDEDDEMKENAMEEESEDDGSGEENEGVSVVEDKFLKIKELEKYLKEDEEREYGLKTEPKKAGGKKTSKKDSDDDEEEGEDEDEDDQLGLFEEGDEDDELANARYEDFYVSKNKDPKKKRKENDGSDDSDAEDEQEDSEKEKKLSRHEIEQKKIQAKIEEMEKANLDPRTWTMQGEVTAAKRPLNSALEADLDFEHNVRPPPVITEEVTASIEEIIKKRINEGRFDGVLRAPKLPSKAPRAVKELDESKSKKGLADIYEEEYLEKTGLAPASLSFSDELKKEASMLFKRLTLKLNALSHFHFAPKPVVEDMAVETNLPALAMEEVAPVAVSDAAMLAPEEVFAGVGDVKEEAELTQEERKRRRAKKKRKFKAEQTKRMAKKPRETPVITQGEGKVAVIKA